MSFTNQFVFQVKPGNLVSAALDYFVENQLVLTVEDWDLTNGWVSITPLDWATTMEADKQQFVAEFEAYLERG